MVSRHRRAYEKKFAEHGLQVLLSETFNERIMERTSIADPCHIWILEPQQQPPMLPNPGFVYDRALGLDEPGQDLLGSFDSQSCHNSEVFDDLDGFEIVRFKKQLGL